MALVDSVTANAVGEGEEREGGRGVQKEGAEESRTSTKVCESMHTLYIIIILVLTAVLHTCNVQSRF